MKDGTPVTLRPIRPEDEPLMVKFHEALSERSVFLRYFQLSKVSQRVAHDRLRRICFLDYDREIAIVADRARPDTGEHEILAIGRLSKLHGRSAAEVALLVRDEYQHRGLGIELLRRLIEVARDEHLDSVQAYMLRENVEMRSLIEWPHYNQADAFRLNKVINEPDFLPLHIVRILAQAATLVRAQRGKLVTTPLGKSMLSDERQGSAG